jgi:hypothetical protein
MQLPYQSFSQGKPHCSAFFRTRTVRGQPRVHLYFAPP